MFARHVLSAVLVCSVIVGIQPWLHARNPFELPETAPTPHQITECMHVASEAGDYVYKQLPPFVTKADSPVCGLYVLADPDKVVEMTVKFMHATCDSGALLAFVDGWELNGQYFPSERDHQLPLERRVIEFCNGGGVSEAIVDIGGRLFGAFGGVRARRTFRSMQNAALLQYRLPVQGSFVIGVRFVDNKKPCHILTEGVSPTYVLQNIAGQSQNCTLTALYPAVVDIKSLSIGNGNAGSGSTAIVEKLPKPINFNCAGQADRLDIGGSAGLDSSDMELASSVCGRSPKYGSPKERLPSNEQAILCGVTTLRLLSSGRFANRVSLAIRPANFEIDMNIASLVCGM